MAADDDSKSGGVQSKSPTLRPAPRPPLDNLSAARSSTLDKAPTPRYTVGSLSVDAGAQRHTAP